MDIYIISKATPEQLPPIITLSIFCKELGYNVKLVTQNTKENNFKLLSDRGIDIINLINRPLNIPVLGKLYHWYTFRRFVNKILSNVSKKNLLWVSGADTMILIKDIYVKNLYSYLQLNELCDELPIYRYYIKKKANLYNKVILPEINRTHIAQVLYKLKNRPYVLPNKPYDLELTKDSFPKEIDNYLEKIEKLKSSGKIIFIYQGYISELRDMTQICHYVENHKDKCALVLMGNDEGALTKYKSICPGIIHVPFISAPWHLIITSHCDIGIMVYLPVSLNNIYCAPNKIWEYSKFGLAMVGNDIPGLHFLNEKKIGCTVALDDKDEIEERLNNIVSNIESIKGLSFDFYNSLDMAKSIKNILSFDNL